MILDAFVGLFGSIFDALAGCLAAAFVPFVNLFAALIELVVGIFISGFQMGRLQRRERKGRGERSAESGWIMALVLFGMIVAFFVLPKVMSRNVTLVAKDGHSLPFAAVIIHTKDGERHVRSDNAGNIAIPRFSTEALTIKDPRYVEQTWKESEIDTKLTARRTVLGAGLDSLAGRLLKPAKE